MAKPPQKPPVSSLGLAADRRPAPIEDRVAGRDVVIVDGKKGVFIPIDQAVLTDEQTAEELVKTVELLQSIITGKDAEILGLNQRVAELLSPPQSPDDFSTAMQSAVDTLQTQLSHLSNPIANFAVKEFKIDARVGINITPLGVVEYRFAGPGERISPESQSQLTLTLVPVEKTDQTSKDLDRFLAPLRPIAQIPDIVERVISPDLSAQKYFESNHIYTIGDFLRAGSRANIKARILSATKIDSRDFDRWLDIAELLLIKDVDFALAVQMQEIGISGMRRLQAADAENLLAKLSGENLSIDRIRAWQAIAKKYVESRQS
jgi:hypothetical protein